MIKVFSKDNVNMASLFSAVEEFILTEEGKDIYGMENVQIDAGASLYFQLIAILGITTLSDTILSSFTVDGSLAPMEINIYQCDAI